MSTILMTEEYWANSYFSIARYTGEIDINGTHYVICDKHSRDIWECSAIAQREGRSKAIEPGEPADLIDRRYLPVYRAVGRDRFMAWLNDGTHNHSIGCCLRLRRTESPKTEEVQSLPLVLSVLSDILKEVNYDKK